MFFIINKNLQDIIRNMKRWNHCIIEEIKFKL